MGNSRSFILIPLLVVASLWAMREYQIWSAASSPLLAGPDVIVGDIPSVQRWGALGNETAFSIGTTSCNIGTARMDWIQNSTLHPVISQNLYRVKNGRIEQIGMSWLKHGFSVAAGSLCNTCTDPASNYLGVGCSDPYGASLNGSQGGLGPRSEVNATTGAFPWPKTNLPSTGILDGRIRVLTDDITPALNPGARYFVESMYVHPQDAAAGNGLNNASYREAFTSAVSGGFTISVNSTATTVRQQPAINAWKAVHSDVKLYNVDVPGDGRIVVGIRTTPSGSGYHTEIAIENLNSHRSVRSLTASFGPGSITNPGFRDVDYQFEPYSGTDWTPVVSQNELTWSTQTFSANQNANAIRWNTLYSFWCDSALPARKLTLGMFRPGTGTDYVVDLVAPVNPSSHTLSQGIFSSGQLSSVFTSDNQYFVFKPGPKTAELSTRQVELVFDGTCPVASPADFAFRLEASMTGGPAGDVAQVIEMYNFLTSSYEQVDQRLASNTDLSLDVTPTGGWSRFIQSGTRQVRARVRWNMPNGFPPTGSRYAWVVNIDQAVWLVPN